MAMPTVNSVGAVISGAAAITVAPGGSHTADDIDIVLLECSDLDTAALTTANGFARLTALDQIVTVGSASTGRCQMSVWWRRWNGTDGSPVFADSGDHQIGRMISVSGCKTTGDPWNVLSTGTTDDTQDTSLSAAGATTTAADCLVLAMACQGIPDQNTADTQFGTATNSDLANLTDRVDDTTAAGDGGAIWMVTGEKASAGAYGATTCTTLTSSKRVCATLALEGPSVGPQTLTGTLFTKTSTFFVGLLATDALALTGTLFVKASSFFAGTVAGEFPGGIPGSKVVAWYAARLTSATEGQLIATFPELSGSSADDLFQNNASKQAQWLDNIVNGLPVLRFSGTDIYKALWNQTIPEPYQVFIVLNTRTPFAFDNDEVYFSGHTGQTNKHLFAITESTVLPTINQPLSPPDWMIEQAGADQHVVGGAPVNDTWYVCRIDFEDTADSVTLNGTLTVGPWSAGHLDSVGITFGAREDGNRGATGDIAELLFCQDLTSGEKLAVQNDLMALYGLTLPASQIPDATVSNDGWDTAPLAGQAIHTYIATDDADYITVTVP